MTIDDIITFKQRRYTALSEQLGCVHHIHCVFNKDFVSFAFEYQLQVVIKYGVNLYSKLKGPA